MKAIKNLLKIIIYPIIFVFGIIRFSLTKTNGNQAYLSFRYLFVLTNGASNDMVSKIISTIIPKYYQVSSKGILGDLGDAEIESVVSELNNIGFHVFDKKLSLDQIEHLTKFAYTTPVSYLDFNKKHITYSTEKVLFDDKNPISPRYQFKSSELFEDSEIQNLAFDQSLLKIANQFLNTKPILDFVSMWWSVPFNSEAQDRAAQKYHFDMDRFKFIKFFFYLTDVDTNTGPHCYVKGSCKNIPKSILKDRRIEDEEIRANYPVTNIVELTAPKGSIIAVDTRGFHKGKSLTQGHRLLLQIQFSNSLFGAPYSKIKSTSISEINQEKQKQKQHTYQIVN